MSVRIPPGLDDGAAVLRVLRRRQLRIGDDVAERTLAGVVRQARQRLRYRSRRTVGDGGSELVVGVDQRGLLCIIGERGIGDDDVLGFRADDVARRGIEGESISVTSVPYLSPLVTRRRSIWQT